MKNNYFKILLLGFTFILFTSCGTDDDNADNADNIDNTVDTPELSSEKVITNLSISGIDATIDQTSNTIFLSISETDLTTLVPTISISVNAIINPASGASQDFTNPITYTVTAMDGSTVDYIVSVESTIVEFTYNGKNYEIVKENRTWVASAAVASERGGFLAEINDLAEQNAIFNELGSASIIASNTVAPDGGNASYVWIGGNDITTEGNWFWDGNNDGTGNQFWMGTQSGSPINSLYNNWGNEPDDFGTGQDGLGLALTDWPLGVAGQWNDVDQNNELYFLIEFD
jgi:hypothetical protein